MVHHKAPHGPHHPAARHRDLLADATLPEPATLLDTYEGRAPKAVADEILHSRMALWPHAPEELKEAVRGDRAQATRQIYQAYMKGHLRLVAALDENVGRLLDYLDQSGLSKNTLVVYTSDNGFFYGEHGFYNSDAIHRQDVFRMVFIRRHRGSNTRWADSVFVYVFFPGCCGIYKYIRCAVYGLGCTAPGWIIALAGYLLCTGLRCNYGSIVLYR